MRRVYTKYNKTYKKKYNTVIEIYCEDQTEFSLRPGSWVNFTLPVTDTYSLHFPGKISSRHLKKNHLNQSVTIVSKIVKEKITFNLPLQNKHIKLS